MNHEQLHRYLNSKRRTPVALELTRWFIIAAAICLLAAALRIHQ
jgi:hypothetical protein